MHASHIHIRIYINSTAYPHAADKSLCVYLLYSIFCLHFQCSFISRIYTVYNTPPHTHICPIVYTSMSVRAYATRPIHRYSHQHREKKPIPFGARARHSIQIFFPTDDRYIFVFNKVLLYTRTLLFQSPFIHNVHSYSWNGRYIHLYLCRRKKEKE